MTTIAHSSKHLSLSKGMRSNVLLSALGVTLIGLILYSHFEHLGTLGYPGVFFGTMVANATVMLPIPTCLIVMGSGSVLNLTIVGLVAAIGATLGDSLSYWFGMNSQGLMTNMRVHPKSRASRSR